MKSLEREKKTIKFTFFVVVVVLLIIAILPSYYFYNRYQKAQNLLKNPSALAKEETKQLITNVSRLIVLPSDEEPTIASVVDKNKLKDQPFFKNSENGDKVLIYTKAKKAILYRPATNKIIEVSPITIGQSQVTGVATATGSSQISPTVIPTSP